MSTKRSLASRVSSPVYASNDPEYSPEIAAFNTAIVHTPDIVLSAASAADIAETVRFARERSYCVASQATGHTYSAVKSGLLVITRRLNSVKIDPETKIATFGGGTQWSSVVAAAAEHGLAAITGSSSVVGAVGYLLGGGLGPLARSHGFSSDYLLRATVVTGSGDILTASADEHPDLLWALRGGKTGLGIVTEAQVCLVPLRTVYGGVLVFTEEHVATVFRGWLAWTQNADPRVTTSASIVHHPDLDAFPEAFRGKRVLNLRFAFPGPSDEGTQLAAPLRSLAPVHTDALCELRTTEMGCIHNDPTEPSPTWIGGSLLKRADHPEGFANVFMDLFGPGADTPLIGAELRHLGQATQRNVPGGSAVSGRAASFVLGYARVDTSLFEHECPRAQDRVNEKLQPWRYAEENMNFFGKARSADQLANAWPPDIGRKLREVRKKYDPAGIFAYGHWDQDEK